MLRVECAVCAWPRPCPPVCRDLVPHESRTALAAAVILKSGSTSSPSARARRLIKCCPSGAAILRPSALFPTGRQLPTRIVVCLAPASGFAGAFVDRRWLAPPGEIRLMRIRMRQGEALTAAVVRYQIGCQMGIEGIHGRSSLGSARNQRTRRGARGWPPHRERPTFRRIATHR